MGDLINHIQLPHEFYKKIVIFKNSIKNFSFNRLQSYLKNIYLKIPLSSLQTNG
jgi:hypothetical protein